MRHPPWHLPERLPCPLPWVGAGKLERVRSNLGSTRHKGEMEMRETEDTMARKQDKMEGERAWETAGGWEAEDTVARDGQGEVEGERA